MRINFSTMKNKTYLVSLSVVLTIVSANAQDIAYVRQQLKKLCSPEFYGRGYYKKGDRIAADHLANEFEKFGLKSYGPDYFQEYAFNVNSLEEVSIKINGKELQFGADYMMNAASGSGSGIYSPVVIDAAIMNNPSALLKKLKGIRIPDDVPWRLDPSVNPIKTDIELKESANNPPLIILDSEGLDNPGLFRVIKALILSGEFEISGLIEVYDSVPGVIVSRTELPFPHFQVTRKALPDLINNIEINVRNRFYEKYPTQNVIGYIPGKSKKCIVFTAHYDGHGSFGENNLFPNAIDNGSGTCMVLDLARHYSSGDKPYYSMVFFQVSAEEPGLVGSRYYVNNPLFPLEDIKLVINLDVVGTGQESVILYNGIQRPVEASIVQTINKKKAYLESIVEKNGYETNSDFRPFDAVGVPAIHFLTRGTSGGGHSVYDTADKVSFHVYENLFKLIVETVDELKKQEIQSLT